jgi:hypothetical protein
MGDRGPPTAGQKNGTIYRESWPNIDPKQKLRRINAWDVYLSSINPDLPDIIFIGQQPTAGSSEDRDTVANNALEVSL